MNIVICDDNQEFLKNLKKDLCASFYRENKNYNCISFTDPIDLINYTGQIDVLLLDVEMPGIDGFTIARQFRDKGYEEMPIIFITSHSEMIQDAFKVKAFGYIYKPINMNELIACINEAISEIKNQLYVAINNEIIKMADIEYLEALGDGCAVHLKNKHLYSKFTLKCVLEELDDSFVQCHKSYAVNIRKVIGMSENNVVLNGGFIVSVSTRKRTEVKKLFLNYINKYGKVL